MNTTLEATDAPTACCELNFELKQVVNWFVGLNLLHLIFKPTDSITSFFTINFHLLKNLKVCSIKLNSYKLVVI
jgi:hypothetical protein